MHILPELTGQGFPGNQRQHRSAWRRASPASRSRRCGSSSPASRRSRRRPGPASVMSADVGSSSWRGGGVQILQVRCARSANRRPCADRSAAARTRLNGALMDPARPCLGPWATISTDAGLRGSDLRGSRSAAGERSPKVGRCGAIGDRRMSGHGPEFRCSRGPGLRPASTRYGGWQPDASPMPRGSSCPLDMVRKAWTTLDLRASR